MPMTDRTNCQFLAIILVFLVPAITSGRRPDLYEGIKAKIEKLWNTTNLENPMITAEEADWLRGEGIDEISHSVESAALRNYKLRRQKWRGKLSTYTDLSSQLFPDVQPKDYKAGDSMWPLAWAVHSRRTMIPHRFVDLPFCNPPNVTGKDLLPNATLGSRLWGVHYSVAPFLFQVKMDRGCTPLCEVSMTADQVKWMRNLITQYYIVEMELDGLPLLVRLHSENYAEPGYPLGFQRKTRKEPYFNPGLFNHVRFLITYEETKTGVRITGFDAVPISILHIRDPANKDSILTCNPKSTNLVQSAEGTYLHLPEGAGEDEEFTVIYSYEVLWSRSGSPWEDRWDVYCLFQAQQYTQILGLFNSWWILVFLCGGIYKTVRDSFRKDLAKFKKVEAKEEAEKDFSKWKLLDGDVLRPPSTDPFTLSVLVGSGVQAGVALLAFLLISATLKPWNPKEMSSAFVGLLFLYALFGPISGYVSARFYKLFGGGVDWQYNAFATAVTLPGFLLSLYMVANLVLATAGASSSVGAGVLAQLLAIWLCLHAPLVYLGSYFGFQRQRQRLSVPIEPKSSSTPRAIPEQMWYLQQPAMLLWIGFVPFSCIYVPLFSCMTAVWWNRLYLPGFSLLLSIFLMMTTCGAVSIFSCYVQFSKEDHHGWWWSSFWNSAGLGIYVFLYACNVIFNKAKTEEEVSVFISLLYAAMFSVCMGLVCGSCGFLASFVFTCKLYGAFNASMDSVGWYRQLEDAQEDSKSILIAPVQSVVGEKTSTEDERRRS